MMTYVWVKRAALAKEIDIVTIPGADKVYFRSGTINSCAKGLAVSLKSKINFFEGPMRTFLLKDCFKNRGNDYIRMGMYKGCLSFRLWHRPGNEIVLFGPPDYLQEFDLWDPKIEWRRCPEDLLEGIAYIENSLGKGAAGSDDRIHIDGNYVGRVGDTSRSRLKLLYRVPFSMILPPAGIGRMRSRLKGKRLRRIAKYVILEEGPGVIFDYGDLRIWNAEVEPEKDRHANLRDFMRRKPQDEMEKEIQDNLRSACIVPPPKPSLVNMIPLINEDFNFQIDSLKELPEDVRPTLHLIKKNTDEEVIGVKIGKKEICFTWNFRGKTNQAEIPAVNPHPWPTISFGVNLFDCERVVRRGTYLGFEKLDSPGKDYRFLYLKDRQGEHLIQIFNIQRGG
jgi:hypothetical protein